MTKDRAVTKYSPVTKDRGTGGYRLPAGTGNVNERNTQSTAC